MIIRDNFSPGSEEVDTELLADEAMKLLQMGLDELYTTLGAQLLAYDRLSQTAGIVSFLLAGRNASMAKSFSTAFPAEPALTEWAKGLSAILETLRQQGLCHLARVSKDLRKALCHCDIIQLSDQMSRSILEIIILIVGATLRMPRQLDPLCATIAVIIYKTGVRNFCQQQDPIAEKAKTTSE